MQVQTKAYKCDYEMTGLLSTNYHKKNGLYMGVKVLCFITNCPNRYYARKAANYMMKKTIKEHGVHFDNKTSNEMPKTVIIPFSDISFAIKP